MAWHFSWPRRRCDPYRASAPSPSPVSPVEDVLLNPDHAQFVSVITCIPSHHSLSRLEHFDTTAVYTNMVHVPLAWVAFLVGWMASAMPAIPDHTRDLAKRGFPSRGTTCYVSRQVVGERR